MPVTTYRVRQGRHVTGAQTGGEVEPPPPPPPPPSGMWIGHTSNVPRNDVPTWLSDNTKIAADKGRIRRSFQPGMSPSWAVTSANPDAAAGIISFHSVRPPQHGDSSAALLAGEYDDEITGWAGGAPTSGPVFGTMSHEMEAPDKFWGGGKFPPAWQHFYTVAKAANPNMQLGPVHMSYQWRPGSATTATPDDWWVGSAFCDYIGVDDYNTALTTGRTGPANDPAFQRWYGWARLKNKPLAVVEYGRFDNPNDPNALANELNLAESWLKSHGFFMWLWWNGTGDQGDWSMTGAATIAAWKGIASRGRQS